VKELAIKAKPPIYLLALTSHAEGLKMSTEPTFEFRWLSPLGISVSLFLVLGVLTVLAGLLAMFLYFPPRRTARFAAQGQPSLVLSERGDSDYFGAPLLEVYARNPDVAEIVDLQMLIKSGLWLAFGIFEMVITWFCLRQGQRWALWTLGGANAAQIIGWAAVTLRFLQRGARVDLDLPPVIFLWPIFTVPVATILGWMGLR
jgi:hypothetical protein